MKAVSHLRGKSTVRPLVAIALTVLPLVVYFTYATWLRPISPFYANYDPEFQYMLNSLETFKGRPYYYADHPGSPLEVAGTAFYALTFPFLRMDTDGFIRYHLMHPRAFLTIAHGFLLLVNAAGLLSLLRMVFSARRVGSHVLGAGIALMYFAIHPMAFGSLMLWSHNSFSFALGVPLLVTLYRLLLGAPAKTAVPWRSLAVLSIAAGFLASITIYLAAWICGCVIVVAVWSALSGISPRRGLLLLVSVVLGGAAGFLLGVLPVLNRMQGFLDWIVALLSHQSPYLLRAQSSPLPAQWVANLIYLMQQLPVLFIVMPILAIAAVIAFWRWHRRWRADPASWAVMLGSLSICLLLMVFIMDHPKSDFMLAVAAVQPVLALALLNIYSAQAIEHHVWRQAAAWLIVGAAAVALLSSVLQHERKAALITSVEQQTALLQDTYAREQGRDQQGLVVVWTYGTYSPCFSWWFGNDSADNAFRKEIGRLCPRQLALDLWSGMVIPRQGARSLEQASWDMIIGCADAFKIPALSNLPFVKSYPELPLACGNLTVAYQSR